MPAAIHEAIAHQPDTGGRPPEAGSYCFGPFELDATRRTLLRNGTRVVLTARLFETLLYLVRNPDRLVEREELERAIWPGRGVQDGNLQKAVSSLRKALEDDGPARTYIVTIPGRGFQFSAPVRFESLPADEAHISPPIQFVVPITVSHPVARLRRPVIAAAIILAVVVGGAAAIAWLPRHQGAGIPRIAPPAHSLAVLPFANMSGFAGQDYFSDGLADELINALGRVAGVHVAARTSAFSFKGTNATIEDISRRLNVAAVLEGSVRRDGQIVHIDVQLIDARTGFPIWSRSYSQNRATDDMLVVQADIIRSVSASLGINLLPADSAKLNDGNTHNPEAFDAYLRGQANNETFDYVRVRQAVADFSQAIALDPGFAQAFAGRALAHSFLSGSGISQDQAESAAAAADAEHAIKLAPMIPEAHRARALIMFYALDFVGAASEIAVLHAMAPDNALAEATRGSIEARFGHRDVAIGAARHALALDPLNPGAYLRLGRVLFWTRDFDEALAAFGHAAAVDKHPSRITLSLSSSAYLAKHEPTRAALICEKGTEWTDRVCLAMAYHALGRPAEAEAEFAKLHQQFGDRAAFIYAEIYAQWGQSEIAMHWLETAQTLRDNGLGDLRVSPFLDPLRDAAKFNQLEKDLKFPVQAAELQEN